MSSVSVKTLGGSLTDPSSSSSHSSKTPAISSAMSTSYSKSPPAISFTTTPQSLESWPSLSNSVTAAAAAFDLPGHSLYLCDPHRLSILSIHIEASTQVTAIKASRDSTKSYPFDSPSKSDRLSANGNAATPTTTANQRLRRLSGVRRTSLSSKPSLPPIVDASLHTNNLSRPKSIDIGSKAKEAFQEIGRFARGVTFAYDKTTTAHTLEQVANSLAPDSQHTKSANNPTTFSLTSNHSPSLSSTSASVCSVGTYRTFVLKPHDFTFGRDSRLTSSVIPLNIQASSHISNTPNGSDFIKATGDCSVEFVADPSPHVPFIQPQGNSSDSEEQGHKQTTRQKTATQPQHKPDHAVFDPSRLLLKVEPPFLVARKHCSERLSSIAAYSGSEYRVEEKHDVSLRFRLRICASASVSHQGSQQLQLSSRSRPDSVPAGLAEVIFISASSPQKLVDAIESPASSLSSPELAALEGITRVQVNPRPSTASLSRGARDYDFEWKWKPLDRQTLLNDRGAGSGKCCCAFVELDQARTKAKLLAAFNFWAEIPPPAAAPLIQTAGNNIQGILRTDSVSLIAALNQDIDRPDLFDTTPSPDRRRSHATPFQSPRMASSPLTSSGRNHPTEIFSSNSSPFRLHVDHTEIGLDDIKNDSPLFRAAIVNLERRTTTVKKVCKAALKAATDARSRIIGLQEAEDVMDDALHDLATLAPETIGKLRHSFSASARERMSRHRREQAAMIEINIKRPLDVLIEQCRSTLEQFKTFEAESKSYYSQTQKWLSNRAVPEPNSQPNGSVSSSSDAKPGTNVQPPAGDKLLKQERADEKQRLRQMRFEQARLDLYRHVYKLHGGEAETELVKCMLRLSMWLAEAPHTVWDSNWPTKHDAMTLKMLHNGVESATNQLADHLSVIKQRSAELSERIRATEAAISKASEAESAIYGVATAESAPTWDLSHLLAGQHAEADNSNVSAAKQAGQKIKNFFGALGMNIQNTPNINNNKFHGGSNQQPRIDSSPSKKAFESQYPQRLSESIARQTETKRKPSLKLNLKKDKNSSTLPAESARDDDMPLQPGSAASHHISTFSPVADTDSKWMATVYSDDRPLNPAVDAFGIIAEIGQGDPKRPTRKPSHELGRKSQAASPESKSNSFKLARSASQGSTTSPKGKRGLVSRRRVSGSENKTVGFRGSTEIEDTIPESSSDLDAVQDNKLSQPFTTERGQDRKKEGVLWVMSKPVSGPGGSDAPRGVNRSTHWRECWVVLSGSGHISEYADWKNARVLEPSNSLIDLRFATVREARGVDRRFTFEVVTRDNRRFFQAPDEATMKEWVNAIGKAIESLLNGTSSVRKLDRAIKGTPFQTDNDLAHPAVGLNSPTSFLDEFATNTAEKARQIARQKAFSQSMTDLTGNGGGSRLFWRNGDGQRVILDKKDSKRNSRHMSTSSESYTATPQKEEKLKRNPSKHERGISNKTPISGYIQGDATALGLCTSDLDTFHNHTMNRSETALSTASSDADLEFDRRIEEMVQNSFGRTSCEVGTSGHKGIPLSPKIPEMGGLHTSSQAADPVAFKSLSTSSTKLSRAAEISDICRRPENSICADCGAPDPRWASWALDNKPCCIFICISCSGVHRSLGVQVSKVKSVDLDDWTEEQVDAARKWGNKRANEVWECNKPAGFLPVAGDRHSFWKMKYVDAIWKRPVALIIDQGQGQEPGQQETSQPEKHLLDLKNLEKVHHPSTTVTFAKSKSVSLCHDDPDDDDNENDTTPRVRRVAGSHDKKPLVGHKQTASLGGSKEETFSPSSPTFTAFPISPVSSPSSPKPFGPRPLVLSARSCSMRELPNLATPISSSTASSPLMSNQLPTPTSTLINPTNTTSMFAHRRGISSPPIIFPCIPPRTLAFTTTTSPTSEFTFPSNKITTDTNTNTTAHSSSSSPPPLSSVTNELFVADLNGPFLSN